MQRLIHKILNRKISNIILTTLAVPGALAQHLNGYKGCYAAETIHVYAQCNARKGVQPPVVFKLVLDA